MIYEKDLTFVAEDTPETPEVPTEGDSETPTSEDTPETPETPAEGDSETQE
ncbi:MAG: hypothetical protein ABH805_01590 [Candidatus Nealsonbacteria bacterium]